MDQECTRTIVVQQKKVLRNGTVRTYNVTRTYDVKAPKYSDETKAEMRRKYTEGVSIARLCADYGGCYATVKKIVA